ncbi:patatin-like phospholipase family protein [Aestuariivirga litoralis]|uniref:Patatin-like phospholipase family protein n=1 Tax=Aestuariivirga litoralis TaxID=2650924 RepID=A0A2W2BTG1_9HYPH|nr:patatin-like phospholipase family protein [Aestuariivirga litoralis]PZF78947.1 patatin-like phospholipase family protein [Aestuariivirga litoralis]
MARRSAHHLPFERVALLLQGGGALGSYQAGVYQAMAEGKVHPDWVAGISIGAVNSAIIAGNAPERRVERLRDFWETVTAPPLGAFGLPYNPFLKNLDEHTHRLLNQTRAFGIMMMGAPGFFAPRPPMMPFLPTTQAGEVSYYDVSALKETLERLVDFDRINAQEMHFGVGAVNVKTGNFIYFDNATTKIGPQHVIASGALPPGFPAVEIDGEFYWDGGLVSNTPLQWMLDQRPRLDTLALQIDLWSARGELPRDVIEADSRVKDIRYSSRTRAATDQYKRAQKLRLAVAEVLKHIPPKLRDADEVKLLAAEADDKICNIVQLIYHTRSYEGISKDFEFSRRTMEEHWEAGYRDALRAMQHPEVLKRPTREEGVQVFDFSTP